MRSASGPDGPRGGGPGGADDFAFQAEVHAALRAQGAIGVLAVDRSLRVWGLLWDPQHFGGLVARVGQHLRDLLDPADHEEAAAHLREVAASGEPAMSTTHPTWRLRSMRADAEADPAYAQVTVMRSPHGYVLSVIDYREQASRDQQLSLLTAAARTCGESLDARVTSQQITDLLVATGFADAAGVHMADEVPLGAQLQMRGGADMAVHRSAITATPRCPCPPPYAQIGEALPPIPPLPILEQYRSGEMMSARSRPGLLAALGGDRELFARLVPAGAHDFIGIALQARGTPLGAVEAFRGRGAPPFSEQDRAAFVEVVAALGLAVDLARRHTREVQELRRVHRSLLPSRAPVTLAQTEARYAPAESGDATGDWWDVVPLSGRRVLLIVGDVVGHGMDAAVMMGQLRTCTQVMGDMDLGPADILARLDDQVIKLAAEAECDGTGATCCALVWDPILRQLTGATAGHPPPVLVSPDGKVAPLPLEPGPPLGLGLLSFEATALEVPVGSTLVMYSDGLVHDRARPDLSAGLESLRAQVEGVLPGDDLGALADRLMRQAADSTDDATLLLARLHGIPADHTAAWALARSEREVSTARRHTTDCLGRWDAGDTLVEAATLIVSELITNAIRYGEDPIGLRLIRDVGGGLIIEVSDGAATAPSPQHARIQDEGGRGLQIVGALAANRWSTRYDGSRGKTVSVGLAGSPVLPVMRMDLDIGDLDDLNDLGDLGPGTPDTE